MHVYQSDVVFVVVLVPRVFLTQLRHFARPFLLHLLDLSVLLSPLLLNLPHHTLLEALLAHSLLVVLFHYSKAVLERG